MTWLTLRSSVVVVIALGLAASCDLLPAASGKLSPYRSVIFPAGQARELTRQCSRDVPSPIEGTWTPTDAQVRALEPPLAGLILQEAKRGDFPDATIDVARYYRQYGGLIVRSKRIIDVNAFDEHLADLSWRWSVPHVCDGGYGLFGVEYDPATPTFTNFSFNGSG